MKFIEQAVSTIEKMDVEYEELVLLLTEQLKSCEDLIHVKHWNRPDLYACFIDKGLLFCQEKLSSPLIRWDGVPSKNLENHLKTAQIKRGEATSIIRSPGTHPEVVAKMLLVGDLELV